MKLSVGSLTHKYMLSTNTLLIASVVVKKGGILHQTRMASHHFVVIYIQVYTTQCKWHQLKEGEHHKHKVQRSGCKVQRSGHKVQSKDQQYGSKPCTDNHQIGPVQHDGRLLPLSYVMVQYKHCGC